MFFKDLAKIDFGFSAPKRPGHDRANFLFWLGILKCVGSFASMMHRNFYLQSSFQRSNSNFVLECLWEKFRSIGSKLNWHGKKNFTFDPKLNQIEVRFWTIFPHSIQHRCLWLSVWLVGCLLTSGQVGGVSWHEIVAGGRLLPLPTGQQKHLNITVNTWSPPALLRSPPSAHPPAPCGGSRWGTGRGPSPSCPGWSGTSPGCPSQTGVRSSGFILCWVNSGGHDVAWRWKIRSWICLIRLKEITRFFYCLYLRGGVQHKLVEVLHHLRQERVGLHLQPSLLPLPRSGLYTWTKISGNQEENTLFALLLNCETFIEKRGKRYGDFWNFSILMRTEFLVHFNSDLLEVWLRSSWLHN